MIARSRVGLAPGEAVGLFPPSPSPPPLRQGFDEPDGPPGAPTVNRRLLAGRLGIGVSTLDIAMAEKHDGWRYGAASVLPCAELDRRHAEFARALGLPQNAYLSSCLVQRSTLGHVMSRL